MSDPRPGWMYDPSDPDNGEVTEEERQTIKAAEAMFKQHDAFSAALGLPTLQELIDDINGFRQ